MTKESKISAVLTITDLTKMLRVMTLAGNQYFVLEGDFLPDTTQVSFYVSKTCKEIEDSYELLKSLRNK